jgi:ATP-dependent Clp protease ATP-binding subunit ClpX
MDNIKLSFDEDALEMIVDKSVEFKLGARGLRSILEAIMTDAMFDLPSKNTTKSLRISVPFVEEKFLTTNITRLKVA